MPPSNTVATLREAASLVCFNCRSGRHSGQHVCAAKPIWGRIAVLESAAGPAGPGVGGQSLDDIAHELAEEYCKSLLDGTTMIVVGPDGYFWYDLLTVCRLAGAPEGVARAVGYLDSAGVLKRYPGNPQLVGWDEDGLDETGS